MKNFYLPIQIHKTTYIEKENTKMTYGKEVLKTILLKELEEQFKQEDISQLNVVNKIVNVYERENHTMELEMTYEVVKEIGEKVALAE